LTAQQKLVAEMLSAGRLDDEHVRPVVDRLIAIDLECKAAWQLMVIRMYPILTPIQRAHLDGLSGRLPGDATNALLRRLCRKE
jgi:hypothetical protein